MDRPCCWKRMVIMNWREETLFRSGPLIRKPILDAIREQPEFDPIEFCAKFNLTRQTFYHHLGKLRDEEAIVYKHVKGRIHAKVL